MSRKIADSKVVSITSLVALVFVVGGWLWAYFALHTIANSPLILHFNDITGITSIGSFSSLLFIGVLGVVVVVMNFFIALELDARDRFLARLTVAVTFIFAVLLFLAFAAIIAVN